MLTCKAYIVHLGRVWRYRQRNKRHPQQWMRPRSFARNGGGNHMFKRSKLSQAITLAIASGTVGISGNSFAQEKDARVIEEITVTASKRAESMQDISIAVQAIDADELNSLDINNFADYVKQLPNVTFAGRGPGQNDIYIRGISTSRGSLFQSGGIGAGPTVAMYIDEAPITAAGRNLDVYVTDMERIEVLPGPQGTLYGGSSQAGTVRFITKKPNASEFDAGIELMLGTTKDGAASTGIEGYVNIPIIEDKFAVRIAAYDVTYGGYIDNVQGTISFEESSRIINKDATDIYGVADNSAFVKNDFNESSYTGARISAALDFNDDWSLLVGYMTQDLKADGVFDYSPSVGDLQVQRFSPDKLKDEFDQFNWTLQGRIGMLDVVYAGSFLERDLEQRIDYVGYTLGGGFQPYYNCTYSSGDFTTLEFDIIECAPPEQRYRGIQSSEDWQHELRFSGEVGDSVQFVAGVYADKSVGGVSQEWEYHSIGGVPPGNQDFAPNAPHSEANVFFDPRTRNPEVAFFNDLVPKSDQLAFFGELTYQFSDAWSATVGLRNYSIDMEVGGSFNFVSGFTTVDRDDGGTLNDIQPENESDTITKFTLTYTPNNDILLFGTFSEGFRRGGFNRQGDIINRTTGEFVFPAFYGSDTIDNYEFGWKTNLADGRLRFNGSLYYIEWSDVQIDIFDQTINQLLYTANAGEAKVTGLEGDFTYLASDNWTVSGAFSFNNTELTSRPVGADNLLPPGSDLPLTPAFQGNVNLRYDFELLGYQAYTLLGVQYRGSTHTSVVINEDFPLASYTTADLSFGLLTENWNFLLFINNLTDERAQLFISNQDDIPRTVTNRPLNVSFKVSYFF
jgi:iron complex outermembrane recepter protein